MSNEKIVASTTGGIKAIKEEQRLEALVRYVYDHASAAFDKRC